MNEMSGENREISLSAQEDKREFFILRRPLEEDQIPKEFSDFENRDVFARQELRPQRFIDELARVFEPYTFAFLSEARQNPNREHQKWADSVEQEDGSRLHTLTTLSSRKASHGHGKKRTEEIEVMKYQMIFSESLIKDDDWRFQQGISLEYRKGSKLSDFEYRWLSRNLDHMPGTINHSEVNDFLKKLEELRKEPPNQYNRFRLSFDPDSMRPRYGFYTSSKKSFHFSFFLSSKDWINIDYDGKGGFRDGKKLRLQDVDILAGVKAILSTIPVEPI